MSNTDQPTAEPTVQSAPTTALDSLPVARFYRIAVAASAWIAATRSGEELPEIVTVRDRFHAYQSLEASGALDAHRARVTAGLQIAHCPWWCSGQHDQVWSDLDTGGPDACVFHDGGGVVAKMDVNDDPGETVVRIECTEASQGLTEPGIAVNNREACFFTDAEGARNLASALIATADLLDEVQRLETAHATEQV